MRVTLISPTPPSSSSARSAVRAATSLSLALLVLAASGAGVSTADAAVATGVSQAGIVPVVLDDGPGGNAICADVPGLSGMTSSDRLEVKGDSLAGTLPAGLVATLGANKRSLSWTSTFGISAVIVKGGDAANVYIYDPAGLADQDLVAPLRPSGQAADVSNVTFCWDPDPQPPIDDPDLLALCFDAATKLDVGDIVSLAGPIAIVDGMVVAATVPAGVIVTYDAMTEQVDFTAPFEVVVAVTASPDPVVHVLAPASTSGSIPLPSNPGGGQLALCGLDTSVVVAVSCAQTGATAELGPIEIRGAAIDDALLPSSITRLDLTASIAFESTVPVVGVMVEASSSVLYAFAEPVLAGSIPVDVGEEDVLDLTFCVLTRTSDPVSTVLSDSPSPGLASTQDPTEIATGGGPSGRTTLSLIAFVILALSGSSTMLLWSRGG
jgi:hypothetical protein